MEIQMRSEISGAKGLTQGQLDAIRLTLQKLRGFNLEQPSNSRDLALHRFFLGSTRNNAVDSLLDYIIALECFLLPYDPATRHSDLSLQVQASWRPLYRDPLLTKGVHFGSSFEIYTTSGHDSFTDHRIQHKWK